MTKRVAILTLCTVGLAVAALALSVPVFSDPVPQYTNPDIQLDIYGKETLPNIGSGKTVELKGTTVEGPVMTGKSIQGSECMTGDMIASENVRITHCKTGRVMAGRNAVIYNSDINGGITASGRLELEGAKITGNVSGRDEISVRNSIIDGTLTASSDKLVVHGSQIGSIRLGSRDTGINSRVVISGGSITKGPSGNTLIKIQGGGKSVFGDFEVEGVEAGTRVVTPEGFVYLNGSLVSGENPDAPANYSGYKQENSQAPDIEGPNWEDAPASGEMAAEPVQPAYEPQREPAQVVELYNDSVVTGDIIFGSGNGLVRLRTGSTLEGKVVGGTLEAR